ncbi:transporter substrate-binding domain-containing protein [Paracoccus sp. MBLB3053]|uniref:Transporter substrate-binding domain-containing protein n=1 Tax=Paracoccus aurantius TaxID=3073814 RepID=A0ABU2HVU7_9RHOB|nr:transporter substrate-binding domain-containing protein [Paracoccus sp. MBLB3053]MDS9469171.1 transporter substrate-binding domain-containing protein [Paracoccus sp. MBLB3053]
MLKKIIPSAVLAAAMAFGTAQAMEKLEVGANIGNVPWEFQDADGKFTGFEVDLAAVVAEKLGRELDIVNIPFNGLFSAVQSGRIDMAMSSITITGERLKSVSFAQPYYDSDQSLTVLADGPASLDEMEGKTVGVDTGSTGDMWVTENGPGLKLGEVSRYEGLSPAMLDLTAGRIDGYISDIPALQYYVKDKPNLKVVQRIATGEKYSFMFAKDAPLAAQVDGIITELKQDGTLAALHEKWFGAAPEAGTSTVTVLDMPKAE